VAFVALVGEFRVRSAKGITCRSLNQLVGHIEEDPVLLSDVGRDQLNETRGRRPEGRLSITITITSLSDQFSHGPHQRPALLVFTEHHPHRARVRRHAACLKRRKQDVLLFGMMTGIGEESEEGDTPVDGVDAWWPTGNLHGEHPIQYGCHGQDELVFFA